MYVRDVIASDAGFLLWQRRGMTLDIQSKGKTKTTNKNNQHKQLAITAPLNHSRDVNNNRNSTTKLLTRRMRVRWRPCPPVAPRVWWCRSSRPAG